MVNFANHLFYWNFFIQFFKSLDKILKWNKMCTSSGKNIFLFYFFKCWQLVSAWLVANIWNNRTKTKVVTDRIKTLFHFNIILQTQQDVLYQALIHLTDFSKNLSSCFTCCLHNSHFYHHRRSSFCVPFSILWRTRCLIYV